MCFKKSVFYITIISVCGICSYPMLASSRSSLGKMSESLCRNALLTDKQHTEHAKSVVQECISLYPLKDPNDSGSVEESQQIHEENQRNCALKCINENLNVTTDEGLIDVSRIREVFLESTNATKPYVRKLTSLMSECERIAGDKVQDDGGIKNNTCKYHVLFMYCYSEAYLASRNEILKSCQESGSNLAASN